MPDNEVRIALTRAAEKKVMDEFLVDKVTRHFSAVDEVHNNTSWLPAAEHVSRRLDSDVYEYSLCKLFVNAIIRATFYERHSSTLFSQCQLVIVIGLPESQFVGRLCFYMWL